MLTQFAAGTALTCSKGDGDVAEWSSQGVLEPLDPCINGDNPLDMNVFYPAVAATTKSMGNYLLTKDQQPAGPLLQQGYVRCGRGCGS
jgi:hypothetical protein